MLILSVPILLLTWKMCGFKQKVLSSQLFIRYRYEYLEIKAEMLISWLIFIFWCQTQMFSVYSKNKGIGLTVPILLKGSVCISVYMYYEWHCYLFLDGKWACCAPCEWRWERGEQRWKGWENTGFWQLTAECRQSPKKQLSSSGWPASKTCGL